MDSEWVGQKWEGSGVGWVHRERWLDLGVFGLWCEKLIGWKLCGIYESDPNEDCQDTEFQQVISCDPTNLSVEGLGCIQLNGSPKGYMEFTKWPMLMPRQKVALHILTTGTYSEKSNHTTHATWRSQTDIYMDPSFLSLVSSMWEGTCWLLKEKHGNQLRHKTLSYNLSGTIYYSNGSTGGSSQSMSGLT